MTDQEMAKRIAEKLVLQDVRIAAYKQALMLLADKEGLDFEQLAIQAENQLSTESIFRERFRKLELLIDASNPSSSLIHRLHESAFYLS